MLYEVITQHIESPEAFSDCCKQRIDGIRFCYVGGYRQRNVPVVFRFGDALQQRLDATPGEHDTEAGFEKCCCCRTPDT